jgi:hypothetical protein
MDGTLLSVHKMLRCNNIPSCWVRKNMLIGAISFLRFHQSSHRITKGLGGQKAQTKCRQNSVRCNKFSNNVTFKDCWFVWSQCCGRRHCLQKIVSCMHLAVGPNVVRCRAAALVNACGSWVRSKSLEMRRSQVWIRSSRWWMSGLVIFFITYYCIGQAAKGSEDGFPFTRRGRLSRSWIVKLNLQRTRVGFYSYDRNISTCFLARSLRCDGFAIISYPCWIWEQWDKAMAISFQRALCLRCLQKSNSGWILTYSVFE